MQTSSAKQKGRKLQQRVRDLIIETFNLEPDDVRSASMGAGGEDVLLSPAARKLFDFSVECKNQEHISIWKSIEQAEKNSNGHTPLLIFSRNRSKTYACIEIEKFMELFRK